MTKKITMKNLKRLVLPLGLGIFLMSCLKEPDHSIRIKNNYSKAVNSVRIGSVSYGTISANSQSNYKPVDEGNYSLSGSTTSGERLTGSVGVSGKGKHDWTLTITSSGGIELKED